MGNMAMGTVVVDINKHTTKVFRLAFGAAVCCCLTACFGKPVFRVKDKPKAVNVQAKSTEKLPAMPDKTTNNATLAGIDTTGTGVRDDVHIWIYQNYTTKIKRTILMTMAKALQDVIVKSPKTNEEARVLQEAVKNASSMLKIVRGIRQNEAEQMDWLLYTHLVNTSERMKAYLKYNLLLGEGKSVPKLK